MAHKDNHDAAKIKCNFNQKKWGKQPSLFIDKNGSCVTAISL